MLPYSSGLILDNANNYGIVKTDAVFNFGRHNTDDFVNEIGYNASAPIEWLITPVSVERRNLQVNRTPKELKHHVEHTIVKPEAQKRKKMKTKRHMKKQKREGKGKGKKCVYELLKKNKRNRRKGHKAALKKKYLVPLIIGLLAAKSVLIPIALKALAFMSAKGFLMGFFSTILASFLSLKGLFDHSHRYQDRNDEKTQVEIIQLPSKESHYYDEHYRRGDYIPSLPFGDAAQIAMSLQNGNQLV